MNVPAYPGGKRFAFTIMDDTDVATVANVKPVYRLLEDLGMRTTKTVWPVDCPEGSRDFSASETLDDPEYREFVTDLHARGFEIAFHGATMESSERARTVRALESFRDLFGGYPTVHANHSYNRENIYWGTERLDDPVLRFLYGSWKKRARGYYQGHFEDSDYWWGDLLSEHVTYVRNLTYDETNVLQVNPTMPYHDPDRPLVQWWFSGCEADSVKEFRRLLRPECQDRLEREGGVCIVATHLGKGYVRDSVVDPEARKVLEGLAARDGWFPPVSELLDWLRERNERRTLPPDEWRAMQWRWGRDILKRKLLGYPRRPCRR